MQIGEISIRLVSGNEKDGERAKRRLKTLVRSIEGMYPMNRSVGIRSDVLDMPIQVAISLFSADIYTKAEKYLPEIQIVDVSCAYDLENDRLNTTIQFELSENELDPDFDSDDYEAEEDEDYERD